MTRILICDDSHDDLKEISALLDDFYKGNPKEKVAVPYLLIRFSNPMDALSYIEDGNAVDIVILDIMMPGINGMQLASKLRYIGFEGYLIFLTLFNDFAAQSYAVKTFSYILKPVQKEKFFDLLQTIEKMLSASDKNGFLLTRRKGSRLILFSELMYVEVMNHTLHFHLKSEEVVNIYGTLKDYSETLLQEPQMLKPQKSFIVNLDYVRSCENSEFIMRDGYHISVPKDFEVVKEKWLERMFGQDW